MKDKNRNIDTREIEKRIHANYAPIIASTIQAAEAGIKLCKLLDMKEQNLRSCENALREKDHLLGVAELKADAWKECARVNYHRARANRHYRWLFWFVISIQIVSIVATLALKHFARGC